VESILLGLAVLACPLGMGLMMWFMARGARGSGERTERGEEEPSVDDLRAQQRRLESEIDRLERSRKGEARPIAQRRGP
jgi:hypothetical protein